MSLEKKISFLAQNWARTVEINMLILSKLLIFRNFDLRHENGSNSVIFGPIHIISFVYKNWQTILG